MTVITIKENLNLFRTEFDSLKEFILYLKNKNLLKIDGDNMEEFYFWTEEEIDKFEQVNTINYLRKLEEKEGDVDWYEIFSK